MTEAVVGSWLVIEDEDDIRNIVKVMFQVWGYTPLEFRNGHEAWGWLDSIEAGTYRGEIPELALMDIRMPGHKGHEIARRMRSVDALKSLPIVLMTAFNLSDGEYQEMLKDCGVDKIIHKPLPDLFELKTVLDTVRDRKRAQASKSATAQKSAPASVPPAPETPVQASAPPAPEAAAQTGDPATPAPPAPPATAKPPDEPESTQPDASSASES